VKQLTSEDRFNVACITPGNPNCPKNPGGDFDIGAPPILSKLKDGKSPLVVGQKSAVAYGLDPDEKGKIVWQTRIGKGGPLEELSSEEHPIRRACISPCPTVLWTRTPVEECLRWRSRRERNCGRRRLRRPPAS
jgi:hypothetical protein